MIFPAQCARRISFILKSSAHYCISRQPIQGHSGNRARHDRLHKLPGYFKGAVRVKDEGHVAARPSCPDPALCRLDIALNYRMQPKAFCRYELFKRGLDVARARRDTGQQIAAQARQRIAQLQRCFCGVRAAPTSPSSQQAAARSRCAACRPGRRSRISCRCAAV